MTPDQDPAALGQKRRHRRNASPRPQPTSRCLGCGRDHLKLAAKNRCYCCYVNQLIQGKLVILEKSFLAEKVAASEYNETLLKLYLTYIRRHGVYWQHIEQTKKLVQLLKETPIPTVHSWLDVFNLRDRYPHLYFHSKCRNGGCPFIKIGRILEELGVIGPRFDEYGKRIQNLLADFEPGARDLLKQHVQALRRSGRMDVTVDKHLRHLRVFHGFITEELCPPKTLLLADRGTIETYLEPIHEHLSATTAFMVFSSIRSFYRWAKIYRKIVVNPCDGIDMRMPPRKKLILAQEDFNKLFTWIKSAQASPEHRLVLSLILFFGFTLALVATAQVEFDERTGLIDVIKLQRKPVSKGRHAYNRNQIFHFKNEHAPAWLIQLQKDYYSAWKKRLEKNSDKLGFGPLPLILDRTKRGGTRAVSPETIRFRINEGTKEALGMTVPEYVLRQTCGHIHSRSQDSSQLSRLGWSPCAAFTYIWVPRTYFKGQSPKHWRRRARSVS